MILFNRIKFCVFFINIFILLKICLSLPIKSSSTSSGLSVPPPEILKFMRRFGYLDSTSSESEALYHESAIIDAVKNIQKYGALNQSGILDNETLNLLISPRCGVPDIEPDKTRTKRYIIGSKRWRKRNIKYYIANWSQKVGEDNVIRDMAKAFGVWSAYSNLKFKRVYDPSADIIVAFGARYHGDNYPFDGPGNILAHAFYPYEMQSYGGDIHFDEDENWKENTTTLYEGVDFYSVAVHELGHSLGLAHSPVYSSIMFPYYKGANFNHLAYDDILAMYDLYIQQPFEEESSFDDDDYNDYPTEGYTTPTTTTLSPVTEIIQNVPTYATTFDGDFETVDDHQRKNGLITTQIPTTNKPIITTLKPEINNIPNICDGHFDAVSVFRGDVFIFKGYYVWRLTDKYRIMKGYPIKITGMFAFLPENTKVDAAYERTSDDSIVMFSGNQFWVYDGYTTIENTPKSISYFGISENVTKIDAAMLWPKNGRTYLFAADQFWRFDEENQRLNDGYPKSISRWHGLPENIDAATAMSNGKTYFFKDNLYWLYNNKWIRPERGYPRIASNAWTGCPLMEIKQLLRN